jgi:hypothetical protein
MIDYDGLVKEYRPSMNHDVLHSWAVDAKSAIETLRAEVERLKIEQAALADANFRQALCIHNTASALGPNVSGTIYALPKAAKHISAGLREARICLENYDKTMMSIANVASNDAARLAYVRAELADTKSRLGEAVALVNAALVDSVGSKVAAGDGGTYILRHVRPTTLNSLSAFLSKQEPSQ